MKLNNLQVLRAVAAYMVFSAHLQDVELKYGQGALLGRWTDSGVWGVDLFFVLSGFVMVLVSTGTAGSPRASGRFLWSRATRIYPLWWLCLTALVGFWLVRPELVYGGTQQTTDLFRDYLLIPKGESPLLQTGWTLIHEMYFYIVFAALLFFPLGHARRLPAILVWAVLAVVAGLIIRPEAHTAVSVITHPMTLEFVAGALCAYLWRATGGAFAWTSLILAVLLVLAGSVIYYFATQTPAGLLPLSPDWERVIYFLPGSALLAYGAASIETRYGLRASGLSVRLGDWSYSLYLTHMLTVNAFGLLWGKVAVPGLWDNVLGLTGITVGCTLVAGMTYTFFEQPALRITRKIGKRMFAVPSRTEAPA